MTALEIIQIIALANALTPEVIQLVNNIVTAFNNTAGTTEEKMKMLTDLADKLQPIQPKP